MKVGKRLTQPMAEEIQRIIYAPRLASERDTCFAPLSAINMAHLVMLHEAHVLEPAAAAAIAKAMLAIDADGPDGMDWDPAREDAYYNYEAALMERAGARIGGQIHAGRSRNDIGATIDRMRVRDACLGIGEQLNRLRRVLLERAAEHGQTVMSGYTHLQAAQPITYGFYLLGLAQALERDAQRLQAAFVNANQSPLGAGALAGTSVPIDRNRTAGLLGFHGLIAHAQDAVASRDFVIDAMNACIGMALTWSRFAQDMYVWSSAEFGLFRLSDRISGTSSIMPQKKNSVVLEHLKAKAAHAIGQQVSMLASVRASHFTMTIDGCRASTASAWPMFKDVQESLALTQLVVEEASPEHARMLDDAADNFCATTDLTDALVGERGLSFRQAHHLVGASVAQLIGEGKSARAYSSALMDSTAQAVIGQSLDVSDAWLRHQLDPLAAVERRRSVGGTAPSETSRLIEESHRRLDEDAQRLASLQSGLTRAMLNLRSQVESLAALG